MSRWALRVFGWSFNPEGIWWNEPSGTTRFMPWSRIGGAT